MHIRTASAVGYAPPLCFVWSSQQAFIVIRSYLTSQRALHPICVLRSGFFSFFSLKLLKKVTPWIVFDSECGRVKKNTKTKKRFFGLRHTSQTFHDQCPEFQVGYDVPVRRWSCVAMWSHRRGVQKLGNKQCCMPIGPQKARNSSETDGQGRYQEIRLRDNIFFQNPTNEDHNNDYYLKQRVPLHQSQGTTGMNLLNGAAIGRAEASEIYCYSPPLPDRTPDN